MVDGTFSDAEVRVVLAHEIGHHSSRHIPKGIAWFALFALPGAWVLMRATRRRGGMGEAAAMPLALLVVAALQLALAPAQTWISRRMEAEADWKALQTTRDPAAARALFVGFGETSLANPDPRTGRTSSSTATRPSRSASPWRRRGRRRNLGARPARQPPDPGPSCRGRGVEALDPIDATSACTRARSRPREASAGRPAR